MCSMLCESSRYPHTFHSPIELLPRQANPTDTKEAPTLMSQHMIKSAALYFPSMSTHHLVNSIDSSHLRPNLRSAAVSQPRTIPYPFSSKPYRTTSNSKPAYLTRYGPTQNLVVAPQATSPTDSDPLALHTYASLGPIQRHHPSAGKRKDLQPIYQASGLYHLRF